MNIAQGVLSEGASADRGFARGVCFGLILAGSLYLLALVVAAWLT